MNNSDLDLLIEDIEPELDLNYKDVRSIISACSHHWREAQMLPYEYGLRLFKIGCIIANMDANINARQITDIIHAPIDAIKRAYKLAVSIGNSIPEYKRLWEEYKCSSFAELCDHVLGKKEKAADKDVHRGFKIMGNVSTKYKKGQLTQLDIREAIRTRDTLIRNFPLDHTIIDKNFLKYYDCTNCGEVAGDGGHELVPFNGNLSIKVPLCKTCISDGLIPDATRVAELYAVHAINSENALFKLTT